jgi:UDP-N-acetylmuramoylalanine--D-glutamate ligase
MRAAVVCGESADDVEHLLCGRVMTVRADGMEDAIITAIRLARSGDAILLSPAATSFDRYGSYEERGEHFASLVRGLVYKDKET